MLNPRDSIPVGAHSLFIEGDTLFLVQNGAYNLEDAQRTHAHVEKVLYGVGQAFVVVDQSRAGTTSGEARRFIAEWNKKHTVSAAAIVGGTAIARTAASLVLSVIRFIRPEPMPVAFFRTEREARAWIAKQRDLPKMKKV
jgi:hypothetical protein